MHPLSNNETTVVCRAVVSPISVKLYQFAIQLLKALSHHLVREGFLSLY